MARGMDRRALGLLTLGHLLNDVNQGAVPALLPFLVTQQALSYTAASGIVVAVTLVSGLSQPLLGLYSDKHPLTWLIPLGMLLGGLGIGLVGLTDNYWLIILFMLISGAGVAAFHPESYRFANYVSGDKRASGMSVFTVGGTLGFAIGPLLLTAGIVAFGLQGTLVMIVPAALYAVILAINLKRISQHRPTTHELANAAKANPTHWWAFATVVTIIVLRTIVQYGVLTFVPLFLNRVRETTITEANAALVLVSVSGAVGTLAGGVLAERFGYKRMLILALLAITPCMLLFLMTDGIPALVALALGGMVTSASFSVAVVLGQSYAQSNIGVASGITTGFAIGLGGLSTPILGSVADTWGLAPVLVIVALVPLPGVILAFLLPQLRKYHNHHETNPDSGDIAP